MRLRSCQVIELMVHRSVRGIPHLFRKSVDGSKLTIMKSQFSGDFLISFDHKLVLLRQKKKKKKNARREGFAFCMVPREGIIVAFPASAVGKSVNTRITDNCMHI